MKEKKQKLLLAQAKNLLYILLLFCGNSYVNAQCVAGCNSNTYVNSVDPNTIEYDAIVSLFHSTIVKESNGTFKIWGEGSAANGANNLTTPTAIVPTSAATPITNYNYGGTALKATGGFIQGPSTSNAQYVLLTTDGLYVWGTTSTLVNSTIKGSIGFGKITVNTKTDGLPTGVTPADVKMMFGAYGTLAIVTCTGDAWVLSFNGSKNGDGTTQNTGAAWSRVKTSAVANLTGVVAMRGTANALFALTSDGKLYTWGTGTYINNSATAATNRTYATEVTVPSGATPKMIGMTEYLTSSQTYYMLATNGKLYAMGNNSARQLGDASTTTSNVWKEVTATNGGATLGGNIVWISPQEHTNYPYAPSMAAINVLTTGNKLWAWGSNSTAMLGAPASMSYIDPTYMPGTSTNADGLKVTDEVIAVETGGHTTINIKKGSDKFGYVGHYVNGSMGNNTASGSTIETYSYSTGLVTVCGAESPPAVQSLTICNGTTANLNDANLAATPSEVEWHATNSASSPVITNITAVSAGTYYAFYTVASGKPRTTGSAATVTEVVCCSTGNCNPNSFLNSVDPNNIEYDNIVSNYHSTIVKESNGTFKIWGQNAHNNGSTDLLSPTAITPANT